MYFTSFNILIYYIRHLVSLEYCIYSKYPYNKRYTATTIVVLELVDLYVNVLNIFPQSEWIVEIALGPIPLILNVFNLCFRSSHYYLEKVRIKHSFLFFIYLELYKALTLNKILVDFPDPGQAIRVIFPFIWQSINLSYSLVGDGVILT